MVSDSIEFVSNFFNETFGVLSTKSDIRINSFKKYCNSIHKMRNDRKEGAVVITVQTMDSFKFLEQAIMNLMSRIESGELRLKDESGRSISNILIASFGKDKDDKLTSSAWKGSVEDFINIVNDTVNSSNDESIIEGSNTFYLRSLPSTILKNKKDVEFIIMGIIIESDDSFYDTAGISIIGIPSEREEDLRDKAVLKMFGYECNE